jgi:hypothetical protein
MRTAAHEKKILENIEELAYCTACQEDYPSHSLISVGKSWRHLCWPCYRKALVDIRQDTASKPGRNSAQR